MAVLLDNFQSASGAMEREKQEMENLEMRNDSPVPRPRLPPLLVPFHIPFLSRFLNDSPVHQDSSLASSRAPPPPPAPPAFYLGGGPSPPLGRVSASRSSHPVSFTFPTRKACVWITRSRQTRNTATCGAYSRSFRASHIALPSASSSSSLRTLVRKPSSSPPPYTQTQGHG